MEGGCCYSSILSVFNTTSSGGMASVYNRNAALFLLLVDNKLVEQGICHSVAYTTKSFILPLSSLVGPQNASSIQISTVVLWI